MQDLSGVVQTLSKVSELVNSLMLVLNQKEKYVIERRFSLDSCQKATLEEIGKKFSVTRERVRQIEKNALSKLRRNVGNTDLVYINEFAKEILELKGGVMREDHLISEILNKVNLEEDNMDVYAIKLSLHLDSIIFRRPNTIAYYPYLRFSNITDELIDLMASKGIQALKGKSDVMPEEKLITQVKKSIGKDRGNFSGDFIVACLLVHKASKKVKSGLGLAEWRHINPRTLRDKIYFVLNDYKKPMHFIDISNKIAENGFDKKTVNTQAVHNELIRSDQFVLMGRGTYALQEWGYEPGTVSDVIQRVLVDKGELSQEDVIKEVLKQRQVKRITIVLNLKNSDKFKRVGRNMYALS